MSKVKKTNAGICLKCGKHKEKTKKEQKIDVDKQTIIDVIHDGLERDLVDWGLVTNFIVKNESELTFTYNENEYTVKLIKHHFND